MNTITVERRDQYGTPVFHPVCDQAQLFARIAKTKTLTLDTLAIVKSLGYRVEVKHPETTI
jgi:hypothetical protein